jgi:hypothetical protein
MRPTSADGDGVTGCLRFECRYFDKTLVLNAGDDIQVFTSLLSVGKAWLQLRKGDGFTVWLHEKGDFDFFDFWSYQEKPTEYCLPSAFEDAAGDVWRRANEGKTLTPSHRVAVEPDRPGVTIYEVQPDGTDRIDGLIRPDDMKGLSPDELCRRLGRMILNSSEEGRQLLASRRGSKD